MQNSEEKTGRVAAYLNPMIAPISGPFFIHFKVLQFTYLFYFQRISDITLSIYRRQVVT